MFIKIAVEICSSKESISQILSNLIWKSITEVMENVCMYVAINSVLKLLFQESVVKEAQQLMDTKKDKANTGTLFSTLLSFYCYKREINLITLLSFPLWPQYLKHFSK